MERSGLICCDWLQSAIDPSMRKKTISRAKSRIKKYFPPFDFVAVRGVSGVLVGIPIADHFKKPLCIIRKEDGSHSSKPIEGCNEGRYIIVDDFISTGTTIQKIKENLPSCKLIGIYLYKQGKIYTPSIYSQKFNCLVVTSNNKTEYFIENKIPSEI